MSSQIRIFGARQNNLKNLDVSFSAGELTVITGVSGSGKSSLAFDTLYAEGQRRYVETFSPYARQFLDRMDKPQVDRIEGILPAIAIDQTNPVRNSRSTVGTMTELNDHFKLLYARAAHLYCRCCGKKIRRDNPDSIFAFLAEHAPAQGDPRLVITFPVKVPANFTEEEIRGYLDAQGYTRVHESNPASARQGDIGASATQPGTPDSADRAATVVPASETATASAPAKGRKKSEQAQTAIPQRTLDVVQDRFRLGSAERERIMEALDTALEQGQGHLAVHALAPEGGDQQVWKFSNRLHCADCNIDYADPLPSMFSFNSPLGACETCRGFGRVIGIDHGLVIPDESKTLLEGAVKPWQTPSYRECQDDLEKYARKAGVPLSVPWKDLPPEHQRWVLDGTPDWKGGNQAWKTQWYGVQRFFDWLESRAYKMHVRVLLSKYRSYTPCPTCHSSRLKPEALLWRIGDVPGIDIHALMCMPIRRVRDLFDGMTLDLLPDAANDMLLDEIRSRLRFLCDVGLGYLTLDRQSRTLSGGEVQRINLTTALGTSLVNTLFVLDEPSIGLHPRDMHRIVQVMHRLRNAGNTLVVVEHDPLVMTAADRVLDIGPGPGERGGRIMFDGTPQALSQAPTLTGDYLSGRRTIEAPHPMPVRDNTPRLLLEGARAHNLRNISVSIPLGRLVCVTGVSGSGKSTLIQDVLYPALLKKRGKPTEAPGAHDRILGDEWLHDVVMVDQTPIGKTARSNPASYVGAYDAIRKLFAQAPLSRERGYTAGMFSFNSGDGRCPSCGGTGFEHVEMQFLSDVYIRCPDCDGSRFRPEVREVTVSHLGRQASIDQVLDMTVNEALDFFKGLHDVQRGLAPLADVGLEYVKLGQPVPTLSGGEAQRLKLAGHLAEAARSGISIAQVAKKASLFLFDEPTTGLHFEDVARLMRALRKLLAAGHTLLVIEHNLDVIRAADWIIDLGPEGGEDGGELIACGTPEDIMAHPDSHTGQALREYQMQPGQLAEPAATYALAPATPTPAIEIHHAREHNLKNLSVAIPRDTFTVITGVSGSGKSTLAFDILFNEGQRRYLESLNAYARSIVQPAGKPDVDSITGIPPTVAIAQRTSRGGVKSTVATMTEIHHFLRLLFVKLGTQYSPDSGLPVEAQTPEQILARIMQQFKGQHIGLLAPLVTARKGYYTDLAKWAERRGHTHLRVDGRFVAVQPWPRLDRYREHTIELPIADVVITPDNEAFLRQAITDALEHGKGMLRIVWPLERLHESLEAELDSLALSTSRTCPVTGISFPELDPRMFSYNSKHGWCPACFGTGLRLSGFDAEQTGEESTWRDTADSEQDDAHEPETCPVCQGQRLNRNALAVRWHEHSIADISRWSVNEAHTFFTGLVLRGREADIARDILAEIRSRLGFMQEVGLGYLTLDRAAPTLSGGEAQRIRLAAQLGSNMQGVCYILDEPTIGLHPRDNRILLDALSRLEGQGNTLVVVEHDDDTIRRAGHVIDIGPGAGSRGGRVVAQGTVQDIMENPDSVTGRYLAHPLQHDLQPRRPVLVDTPRLTVRAAGRHNLHNVTAHFPLNRLTVVTGVSGSGKSTLARDVLQANLRRAVADNQYVREHDKVAPHWLHCTGIDGWEAIDRVLEVDQTPIGKTPRSCPATYIGFWDDVRKLFAEARDARMRGWTASRFSFNTGAGRCPVCEGQGMRTIEMSFLPDVKVECEACNGARFNSDTLSVKLRGKSAGDILKMEVDEAVEYFSAHPRIQRPLQLMQDVGLGYLTLGQPSPTLSGGEAQRIKLVTELTKARLTEGVIKTGRASRLPHTLYVLDEPTVGLSMADVDKLIGVLHRLVEAGNTVVVIEHNLDVIAQADWLLDMGPEGGSGGGRLVIEGMPAQVEAAHARSHTGEALRQFITQQPTPSAQVRA